MFTLHHTITQIRKHYSFQKTKEIPKWKIFMTVSSETKFTEFRFIRNCTKWTSFTLLTALGSRELLPFRINRDIIRLGPTIYVNICIRNTAWGTMVTSIKSQQLLVRSVTSHARHNATLNSGQMNHWNAEYRRNKWSWILSFWWGI